MMNAVGGLVEIEHSKQFKTVLKGKTVLDTMIYS